MNTQEVFAKLEEGVIALTESDEWAKWLKVSAGFHNYSWRNTLLILIQKPDVQAVRGYRAWQEVGRQVRKGEKAISILAPLMVKKHEDGEDKVRLVGFRPVSVFDVSQTDGEPLPRICKTLDSDNLSDWLRKLAGVAPCPILFEELVEPGLHGKTDGERIIINTKYSADDQVETMLHEIGHIALGHVQGGERRSVPIEQKEFEADSFAYLLGQWIGVDFGEFTFGYVATWMKGDVEKIREAITDTMEAISKAAQGIINQLEEDHGKTAI